MASEFKINIFRVTNISFLYGELLLYNIKVTEQIHHLYLKKVGKVVFPTVIIKSDNIQAISKLVEFLVNPGPSYIKVINYNIYYLVLKKYLTIEYKAENKNGELIVVTDKIFTTVTDASYGNNPDRRSGKEHIFKLFEGAIN